MIKKKICIVDYGFGNITSLENALKYLNHDYVTLKKPNNLNSFTHLFLPGVGSFEAGIAKLKELKWDENIKQFVSNGGYVFGICLGMQLLFKYGTNEKTDQIINGLGLIEGKCEKFSKKIEKEKFPLPHVGFNAVNYKKSKIWNGVKNNSYFYFIHSYRISHKYNQNLSSTTLYGEKFISFVESSKIFASQFHPEKSHLVGLKLINNFCNLE